MKVKYSVLGCGRTQFHSNKTNRDYQRVRLMGFVIDCNGDQVPATADMGFDVALSDMPRNGDLVELDVSELTTKNAMTELTFSALRVLPASAREAKH